MFDGEKKKMSSVVLVRSRSDEEKEISVGKLLLLLRFIVRGIKRAMRWHSYSL